MLLDIYIRVSRRGGRHGDSYISPSVQEDICRSWILREGHQVGLVVFDEDESGARMRRPGLDQILGRIESGEADGAVVAALDRFSRVVGEGLQVAARVQAAGGVIISASEGVIAGAEDSSTLGRDVQLAVAADQLKRIRGNWRNARERAIARGVYISAWLPAGYQRAGSGNLSPDDRTAPHVRRAFELAAAGETLRHVGAYLERHQVRTSRGASVWTHVAVRRLLENRAYLGEARSGDLVNRHAHSPIVSRSVWEAAQTRGPSRSRTRAVELFWLAGVVRCSGCLYAMGAHWSARGLRSYHCRGRHAGGYCRAPAAVSAHLVEEHVSVAIADRVAGSELVRDSSEQVDRLERELEQAEAELAAHLADTELRAIAGADRVRQAAAARVARISDVRDRLAAAQRGVSGSIGLSEHWEGLGVVERRRVARGMLTAILVTRAGGPGHQPPVTSRTRLIWADSDESLALPRSGVLYVPDTAIDTAS